MQKCNSKQELQIGKSFWKSATLDQLDLIVDEVVVLNPPDVQRLDSGPGKKLFSFVFLQMRKYVNLDVSRS